MSKRTLVYTLDALMIGAIVGVIDTLFGRVLIGIGEVRTDYLLYLLPFLALAGILITYLNRNYGGKSQKGMELLFEVGEGKEKNIPKRLIPLTILSTWMTHLFGGSAGREGVAVQLGGTVAHALRREGLGPNASRIYLVTGMAAGFGGLFQTPLAAIFFAMEVLVVGRLEWRALYPATIAAFVASWTSHTLGLEKFTQVISDKLSLSPHVFLQLLVLGVIFGLTGKLFAYLLGQLKTSFAKAFVNPYVRIGVVGLGLSILLYLIGTGRYTGLGTNLISQSFAGADSKSLITGADWILKLLFTVTTIAAGYKGGEVTPLFSIGASLGVWLAPFFGLPVYLVAALGYAAVFAGATSTTIGPILIGCEVFGFQHWPAFLLVCLVATRLFPALSIYGGQKVAKKLQ
ncbi:putative permease, chloride channel [Streptococcus australis]|uniref:Putative permease, chloride channel n=2 Tax=Streptococcus TaxID=1301 RepID=A0A3S4PZP6_9STRE|nr:putative permease, chloride channel [Streptococcus viridans]VEE19903.1 putative permease, chloride channel [Streptococcus australis]